jgi:hypothetical protein
MKLFLLSGLMSRAVVNDGIGPRYRLVMAIYGREMDQTFRQNSCFPST